MLTRMIYIRSICEESAEFRLFEVREWKMDQISDCVIEFSTAERLTQVPANHLWGNEHKNQSAQEVCNY